MSYSDGSDLTAAAFMPLAKKNDVVVQEADGEFLVYDVLTRKAHHLNATSSRIWKLCDGKNSVEDISSALSTETREDIGVDFVWIALDEMRVAGLLEPGPSTGEFPKLSRRKVLFRYALPAVVLPAVVSLVAPQAASAQSCAPGLSPIGGPCTSPADCCPGLTCLFLGVPVPGVCGVIIN